MKCKTLALALALSPTAAVAFSPAQCDSLTSMAETAMDSRISGAPIHRTLQLAENNNPREQRLWASIVMKVYNLPTAQLAGPQRADILTDLYVRCLSNQPGE